MTADWGDRPLWERGHGETPPAWEAFTVYRDQGPKRSIVATAKALRKSPSLIGRWSSDYRWVERTEAFDNEQDRIRREEQADAVRRMNDRHAQIAAAMTAKVAGRIQQINPEDLTPSQAMRWLEIAAKVERVARGEQEARYAIDLHGRVDTTTIIDPAVQRLLERVAAENDARAADA